MQLTQTHVLLSEEILGEDNRERSYITELYPSESSNSDTLGLGVGPSTAVDSATPPLPTDSTPVHPAIQAVAGLKLSLRRHFEGQSASAPPPLPLDQVASLDLRTSMETWLEEVVEGSSALIKPDAFCMVSSTTDEDDKYLVEYEDMSLRYVTPIF